MSKSILAVAAAAVSLFGGAALAADPVVKPATAIQVMVAPKFDCSVKPVAPPASADLFQTTSFTLTFQGGTLPKDAKKVEVRLGIQPTGGVITTFCSTDFAGRVKTQTQSSVIVAPPIMDPNYIWLCNAKVTSVACDPKTPPAVPN